MLRTREARSALSSFAKLLRTLPKPVLLVLDTCEELAKLHPAGSRIPAVDTTFKVLELLHDEESSFRVLFAGRRLLAPAGRNWRADEISRPPYLKNLDERPYLRLFEARGFDAGEVDTYLRKRRELALRAELLNAVLAFSAELGRVPGVPKSGDAERPRYNPYGIDLLADWLQTEPDIDAAALTASGLDGYVAARIFGRLDSELQPTAAAVALLGRFDERLLSLAGVPVRDSAGRSTISKLLEQEWIDLEREDSSGSRFLQVRPALWPRLERYASSAEFAQHVGPVRPRLLRELRAHLEDASLRTLSFEAVEAYLRLAGMAEACAAWAAIERRAAEAPSETAESAWSWAQSVAERLVGEAGGVTISPLLAAVSATLAAAVARTEPAADLRPQWTAVLAGAAAHPDPDAGVCLERRAHLGLLVADARQDAPGPLDTHLSYLHEALRSGSDLAGGILASVEALLESRAPLDVAAEEFGRWLDTAAAGLAGSPALAWGRSIHARLMAREGNVSAALRELEEAQTAALLAKPVPMVALLDWSPPASVLHRIRAERLWLEWVTGRAAKADRIRREVTDAIAAPSDDGWCLIALAGVVLVDHGHIAEAMESIAGVSPLSGWSPRCALHRGVPPMAAVQAQAMLAAGAGADAQAVLRVAITQLSKDRARDERVARLRMTQLELIRALRDQSASSVTGQAIYSDNPSLGAAGWLAAALIEPPQTISLGGFAASYLSDDALVHARFRSSTRPMLRNDPALVAAVAERASAARQPAERHGGLPITTIDLCLDALELAQLGLATLPDPASLGEILAAHITEIADAVRPGTEFVWARLHLRLTVLVGDTEMARPTPVPVHRLGRLSLEEGELLALRLPALSKPLLESAYTCGLTAGDHGMEVAAAVTSATASVHAGDRSAVSGQLERARHAWGNLGLAVDGLPTWAELAASPEPAPSSQTVAASAWNGWVLRLRALLGHGAAPLTEGPAEFDLRPWNEDRLPTQELKSPPATSGRRISRPVLVTSFVAGGAIATTVIIALSALVRIAVPAVVPSARLAFWPSFWITWGVVLLITGVSFYGPRAIRRIAHVLMALFREDVTCRPVSDEKAQVSFITKLQPAVMNTLAPPLANTLELVAVSAGILSLLYFGPYGLLTVRALRGIRTVEEIPLAPKRPSAVRAGRLAYQADRAFRITAALRTEAYVDQPWELLLAVSKTAAGIHRRCFRAVSFTAARPPDLWPTADHTEVVSAHWRAFADDVWQPSSRRASKPGGMSLPQEADLARVVHVIGTPLLTSTGWCLRVAGSRSSQVSESFETSQYSPARVEQIHPLAPDLLGPDDPALAAGAIIVVQVDPSGSSVISDPDQAAGLRQFGHQVVVATGRPVIVVPSLPANVARRAIRSLARSARRQRKAPSLDRVLDWVDGLRRAVLGSRLLADGSWDKITAAYDIVLFWPEPDRKEK